MRIAVDIGGTSYGVALDPELNLDQAETARLQAHLTQQSDGNTAE